jgi:hypothetical protein
MLYHIANLYLFKLLWDITLEAIAYDDRQERKDAHDLVYCLEHVPQTLKEATMFRDNMDGNHRDVLRHSLNSCEAASPLLEA